MPLQDDTWSLFRASPTPGYVTNPDAPDFTIVEINDALLRIVGAERDTIVGKRLFDAFPDPSEDKGGQKNLSASLKHVLKYKEAHQLVLQQYDVLIPGTEDFEVRYWSAQNTPVLNKDGAVCYILHSTEDITDRVLLQHELRDSEHRYQSLFTQNPRAVFSLNPGGYFTSINPVAVQIVQYSEAQLLAMHFSSLCLPEDLERIENALAACLNSRTADIKVPVLTAVGKRLELNITLMPVMINGLVTGVYGIARDETEKVKENKEKYLIAKIVDIFNAEDSITDCLQPLLNELCLFAGTQAAEVWISSLDHKELNFAASHGIKTSLKADEHNVIGAEGLIGSAWSKKQIVLIHDLQSNPGYLRTTFALENKLQSGITVPIIFNDQVIAVLAFYTHVPVLFDNAAVFTSSLLNHLASHMQRKKAEHELSQYFNLSPDVLCILGYDGYFKKINPTFSKILGYSTEDIISKPFYEFVHPEDQDIVKQEYQNLKLGFQTLAFEVRYLTKEREVCWISWTASSIELERIIYAVARNVTEKKHLEKLVEFEQKRFERMFNEAPVSMAILKGKDHVFERVNSLYYQFTPKNNIIGKTVKEVFPESASQDFLSWLDHAYETGETFSSPEGKFMLDLHGHGELQDVYLNFMYQPYRNSRGEIEGIFYFGVDVTEQVIARKRIEESEKQYSDLIQNLPAAVYSTDAHGHLKLYNKAVEELLGFAPQVGKTMLSEQLQIYNTDYELIPPDRSPMAISLRTGIPQRDTEVVVIRTDGMLRNIIPYPSPVFNSQQELVGGINILVDITEIKQAQEELRKLSLIAKKTDNAVIITDPEGRIEWVNEAFTRITEFRFEEVIGKYSTILHGPDTSRSVLSYIKEKSKKKQPFECEILKYTKSGKQVWMEIKHQPLFDSNGKITQYFNLEADITERKRAYEKLLKSESEIRSFARKQNSIIEQERARIAREIHDEFGQQLSGLKMSLSSLKTQFAKNPANAETVLTSLLADVDQSIQFLREFATELRPGILDTLGLFPSIAWLSKEFEKKTGITCFNTLQVMEDQFVNEPLSICFFRICQEALSNVAKHSGASQVHIDVKLINEVLSLKISDNGKGIVSDKLHDPLSMGLIGMRERASLIGGYLTITSLPDTRTTVQLLANINNA